MLFPQKKPRKGTSLNLKAFAQKGNHKQNEKTTHRMGENISKRCNRQGISLQNIQIAHIAQYQKNKQANQKMGRRSK